MTSPSVIGVLPAVKIKGMFAREAFMTPVRPLEVPDIHMNHYHLRFSGDHGESMGHTDGREFMGHQDRLGKIFSFDGEAGEGVHQRCEVRTRVPEEILDPSIPEELQVSLGDIIDRDANGGWKIFLGRLDVRHGESL